MPTVMTASKRTGGFAPAAIALALVVLAMIRIVLTYPVFNNTADEPYHFARGMEWLQFADYPFYRHPPLAPVAIATLPYLDGVRIEQVDRTPSLSDAKTAEGLAAFAYGDRYDRNLFLARLGVLPFFALACLGIWQWGRHLFGPVTAAAGVGIFSLLPLALAHAGTAATDMAVTAMIVLALYAFLKWLEKPAMGRAVVAMVTATLAVLAKYSAVVFLPAAMAVTVAMAYVGGASRERRLRLPPAGKLVAQAGVAVILVPLLIWAAFRFDVSHVVVPADEALGAQVRAVMKPENLLPDGRTHEDAVPIPAYPFLAGLTSAKEHNEKGHSSFFLGRRTDNEGSPWFFPVLTGIKTPLPALTLIAVGAVTVVAMWSRARDARLLLPLLYPLVFLAMVMPADINIGLRHYLGAFPFLAVVAGVGLVSLWHARRWQPAGAVAASLLAGWLAVVGALGHPDYLAYFNPIAADRPEHFTDNSDLDWGQDLKRLRDTLAERGIDDVWLVYHGSATPDLVGLTDYRDLEPERPVTGWIAISLRTLQGKGGYDWLRRHRPVETVGSSIRLYCVEPHPPAGPCPDRSAHGGDATPDERARR